MRVLEQGGRGGRQSAARLSFGSRAFRVSVHDVTPLTRRRMRQLRANAPNIDARSCSPPSTMSFVAARGAAASRLLAARRPQVLPLLTRRSAESRRNLLNFLRRKPKNTPSEPKPILSQDDLFHPFSQSPFPAIRARGEAIQKLAPCPTCLSEHTGTHAHTKAQPKSVKFECPDCGWPTHCSEEHWKADENHAKYCSRLREVNEDDHDLRSGRRIQEFELPGASIMFCVCIFHSASTGSLLSRSPRHRGGHIICQLGCLLVYSEFPIYGYRTFSATFQQVAHLPPDHRLCVTSMEPPYVK